MVSDVRGALPLLNIKTKICDSPHLFLLGAGASRACCLEGDKNGLKIPVMSDFFEVLDLKTFVRQSGYSEAQNLEVIYSDMYNKGMDKEVDFLNDAIIEYFSRVSIPDHVTIYDYLVLGLRSKDYIISFNWDPLLVQAYKRWRHLGDVLPHVIFLHGNVDLAVNNEDRQIKFKSDLPSGEKRFSPSQLLFPVENKNYNSDKFISDQWNKCQFALSRSYMLSVFGYSAPQTDVEARALLLKSWNENLTRGLSEIDVIDIADEALLRKNWKEFIVGDHFSASKKFDTNYIMYHPRRTCEAFAFATLQQDPWATNAFLETKDLDKLQSWILPLITEEQMGKFDGKPK